MLNIMTNRYLDLGLTLAWLPVLLARKSMTQNQEAHIKSLVEKIGKGLDTLDFAGKRELLSLLVEKVLYNG